MGKQFATILPEHEAFIREQRMFFVGSAPLSPDGRVNLSPKGYDTFRILSSNEVAYLDLTGSGNETGAHVGENGRITFMFVAFHGPPMIMRLYGKGTVILPGHPRWKELAAGFASLPGTRQFIHAEIERVKTSCGYSIPFFQYAGERKTLQQWAVKKGEEGLREYRKEKNAASMDGIPAPLCYITQANSSGQSEEGGKQHAGPAAQSGGEAQTKDATQARERDIIYYEGKKFSTVGNTANGEVGSETVFTYHQEGSTVWAEYSGGGVRFGSLIAAADADGNLDMRYHHVNEKGELMTGVCKSTPERNPDGKWKIHEEWQWTCKDHSNGTSVLKEI